MIDTLNNPTPADDDEFGVAMAVSGNTVVVGAYLDDTGALDAGSAYVFNAATGALIDTLNNPTPADDDEFGVSMAVSGNTVVVGAQKDDTQNTDQGAAYVYSIAAPTVQSLRVNDGSVQRSQVKGLAVKVNAEGPFGGKVAPGIT